MPENTKDTEAVIAFARAVQEAQARGEAEHSSDREQRYLERSKALPRGQDFETPDERTQRYLQKSRQAHDVSAEAPGEDYEMGEDGQLRAQPRAQEPLSWSNVGERMANVGDGITPYSPEKQQAIQLAIMRARNEIDQKAVPAAHWAKQHIPGMSTLNDALMASERARNPVPRDIGTFERSDSEDMPIRKYKVSTPGGKGVQQ